MDVQPVKSPSRKTINEASIQTVSAIYDASTSTIMNDTVSSACHKKASSMVKDSVSVPLVVPKKVQPPPSMTMHSLEILPDVVEPPPPVVVEEEPTVVEEEPPVDLVNVLTPEMNAVDTMVMPTLKRPKPEFEKTACFVPYMTVEGNVSVGVCPFDATGKCPVNFDKKTCVSLISYH